MLNQFLFLVGFACDDYFLKRSLRVRIHWLANCWNQIFGTRGSIQGVRRDLTRSDRPKGLDGWSWSESQSQVRGTRSAGTGPTEPLERGDTRG